MGGLQLAFEIRKGLHKLSHISTRSGIDCMSRTQMHDHAREKAFGGAHRLKRKMRNVVTYACSQVTHFLTHECAKIHILQNEFNVLNTLIKAGSFRREETRAASYLIARESNETAEERE